MSQPIDSPTRGNAILDLTNITQVIGNIKTGRSPGRDDLALVEFAVLRDIAQRRCEVRPLYFRKANFQRFKDIVNRIHWETSLRDKELADL